MSAPLRIEWRPSKTGHFWFANVDGKRRGFIKKHFDRRMARILNRPQGSPFLPAVLALHAGFGVA